MVHQGGAHRYYRCRTRPTVMSGVNVLPARFETFVQEQVDLDLLSRRLRQSGPTRP